MPEQTNREHKTPYEQKFADLIAACDYPSAEVFIVAAPEVLSYNYEELVESLNRIADSGMKLSIVPRKDFLNIYSSMRYAGDRA